VNGRRPTPIIFPEGNVSIQVVDHGVVKASVPVVVVIPDRFGNPPPIVNRTIVGVATFFNNTSNPAINLVAAPAVLRVTSYTVKQHLYVLDQFGNALNDIYVGTPIYEKRLGLTNPNINNGFAQISPTIQPGGYYLDGTGDFVPEYNVNPTNGHPVYVNGILDALPAINDPTMGQGLIDYNTWRDMHYGQPLVSLRLPQAHPPFPQVIDVAVGGFLLQSGVNRTVTVTPLLDNYANIQIVWHPAHLNRL
jgi:hypothetical protein